MKKNGTRRVLILAGDTDGNIGDRAIVYAMCQEFKGLSTHIEISILSGNPSADHHYFNVVALPRGLKGVLALLRAAKKSDVIICGGGGLFQDDDSLIKMPYWCMRILMLKTINPGAKFITYSLGVGPLRKPSSRLCARLAFACMHIISVRDRNAQQTADPLTPKAVHIVPDPALLLPAAPRTAAYDVLVRHRIPVEHKKIVGVALRQWFHQEGSLIPHKYALKYGLRAIPGRRRCQKMILLIAGVLDRLVREHNVFVLFLPTYNVSHEADNAICTRVMKCIQTVHKDILSIEDPLMYKSVSSFLAVMLGGRMHPTILSVGAGTNIVGLSYNQKFEGFFKLCRLEQMVIPLKDLVADARSNDLYGLLQAALQGKRLHANVAIGLADQTRAFNEQYLKPLLA